MLDPVPDEPAAVATLGDERALVVADYHAGLEVALRYDGIELRSQARERREGVLALLDRTDPDRVVFLGDLANAIGLGRREERDELETLLGAVAGRVPVTIVKGNHDGDIESVVAAVDAPEPIDVTPTHGIRMGPVGFVHGHTWPSREVLAADVVVMGHEHPQVKLADEVGGGRTARAWLRGRIVAEPFTAHFEESLSLDGELVVAPAYNDRLGGTWANERPSFLAPFLPAALGEAQAYLLDGTRLGRYERV